MRGKMLVGGITVDGEDQWLQKRGGGTVVRQSRKDEIVREI